jgi:hypothetical protein
LLVFAAQLTVFTSLTSLVICLIFLLPVACKSQRAAYASQHAIIADVALNSAWIVFWLASAACLSEGRPVGGSGDRHACASPGGQGRQLLGCQGSQEAAPRLPHSLTHAEPGVQRRVP